MGNLGLHLLRFLESLVLFGNRFHAKLVEEIEELLGSISMAQAVTRTSKRRRHRVSVGALLVFVSLVACAPPVIANTPAWAELNGLLDWTVHGWRFKLGEIRGAEAPDFDDSDWELVDVGHQWWPENSTCWYRKQVTIPESINGAPTTGTTVRLRIGVDNEAKAYVNGEFTQQSWWPDQMGLGDFVLAENAQPGETHTVALHGINRPGYGSLYQARFVSDAGEMLPKLLRAYKVADSHVRHASADEAERWHNIIQESMRELAPAVRRGAGQAPYFDRIVRARDILLSDARRFEPDLYHIGEKLAELQKRIQEGEADGRQMAYQRVDARVVESFLQYVRDDMADGQISHAVRALWTVRYLDRVCAKALEEAAAILDDPSLDPVVPTYRSGLAAIHDGAFWQGGRPLFFTGVGHFDQVRRDTPILTEYGFNIIEIDLGPNSVLTEPGTVDVRPIHNDLLKVLGDAAAHNVAVNLHTAPHYLPQWAFERNPKLSECGLHFIPFCIEAPDSRAIHERYLRTLMPLIADHSALHSVCLSNEPQYVGKCDYSRKKFHVWIEEKHGSIESANSLYGANFASFADVPIPEDPSNYPLFFDWCRFNQDRFVAWHAFMRDIVHEYDPDLPVLVKVMSSILDGPRYFALGVNHEDFNQLDAIAGNDCHQLFSGNAPGEYAQHWQGMALNYTFQRSTAPTSPIFNAEDHVIRDGDWSFIPETHIRAAFWTQALHGQGAATTWVWDREQGGNRAENILTRANCVRAMGHVALDLNRLAPEIYALQRVKSDLAILYSHSSLLPSVAFVEEVAAAFEGISFADTTCDFVTERQAAAGKLGDYRVVVVPRASHIPAGAFEAFQDYVASGGVLVTVGKCFTHDEYGRARNETLEQKGSGRLVEYPSRLTARAYREILDDLLDETGCNRPVRMKAEHGESIWGVNLRAAEHDGKWLVSLVNFGRRDQTIALHADATIMSAFNLIEETDAALPITLAPLEPVLLFLELDATTGK